MLDNQHYNAKLTLGALVELEAALKTDSLVELIQRFENGAFSSHDVHAVIFAGLRGGGWQGKADDLLKQEIKGGPLEAARIAARLLVRAFSFPDDDTE